MKRTRDLNLFFLFLLLFLFRSSIDNILIYALKNPSQDESLEITYQNQLETLKAMEKEFQIESKLEESKIYSKALYIDPFHLFETMTILKGTDQNIEENMAVLKDNNLIGITSKINKTTSMVNLLLKPNQSLSVQIKGAYGIMMTNNQKECWIEDINKNVELEVGDEIKTSGLTSIPANIKVGNIEELHKDELGLTWKLKVKLAADFQNISYVTLLKKGDTP